MSISRHYLFAGRIVASEIALPELQRACGDKIAHPAVFVKFSDATQSSREYVQKHRWPQNEGGMVLSGGGTADVQLRFPNLADFIWREGERSLAVHVPDGVELDAVRHLLIDQVLPRVLAHQGEMVLHASAVLTEQGLVAFIGRSGKGKSTLSAALASCGCRLLSDDGLLLSMQGGGVQACATYSGLRLWPDSLNHLFEQPPTTMAMASYSIKRRVTRQTDSLTSTAFPLLAIYVLEGDGSTRILGLSPRSACVAMIANSFQLDVTDSARAARLLRSVGEIVNATPVFSLCYPRRFSELPRVCSVLEQHWCELEEQTSRLYQ